MNIMAASKHIPIEILQKIVDRESDYFENDSSQLSIFYEALAQNPTDRYEFVMALPKTNSLITEARVLAFENERELVQDEV